MTYNACLRASLALVFLLLYFTYSFSQKTQFDPVSPAAQYWQGETFYSESNQLLIEFDLAEKKIDAVSVFNSATGRELMISRENGSHYAREIFLKEGANELSLWSTKKKSRFQQKITVFYNPYAEPSSPKPSAGPMAAGTIPCNIQIAGNYTLTPQSGSNDLIITVPDQKAVDLSFSVPCCDSKSLELSIEDPRNHNVKVKSGKKDLYEFEAKLHGPESVYVLRGKCDGKPISETRIVIRSGNAPSSRLDTAIIFAVAGHTRKARKQGWEDLKYSLNDALALRWTLEQKFGFKTKIIVDPSWEDINETMQALRFKQWNADDQLFLFFTGHGHKDQDGTGYLVPSNAGESIKTYYKMEDLRSQIDGVGCNNIVLGIDACFAATFLERGGRDISMARSKPVSEAGSSGKLATSIPFRYFIGSAPSNEEVPEKGIFLKESMAANGKYKFSKKKFKVSAFMKALLDAIEAGGEEYQNQAIPIWYVGRKIEELYHPKKPSKGKNFYARATRFGSQQDHGFHFIPKK